MWTMIRSCHREVSGFQTISACRDGLRKACSKLTTSPFASF